MALILTFLGTGDSDRTTVALAAAKKFALNGDRVLLAGHPGLALDIMLETTLSSSPVEVAPNLAAVKLQATTLLEQSWEEVKKLEAQYLRSPTLKNVYGQELGVLPGMDSALALNALREYNSSGRYDVIVYDGTGDLHTLRMLGIPEVFSWYIRRFRQVFIDSDLGKAITPFIQPISGAILNVSWNADSFSQPTNQADQLIEEGKAALANPNRVVAYLVTTDDPVAIATAKYLWGSAQQINLTVGGVLLNGADVTEALVNEFEPLDLTSVPRRADEDWQPLVEALPNFRDPRAPKPIAIETAARQVRVFLPGFDKKQVKLTQYGPEITIEAGDQRRNITLPPSLSGQSVKGAKFQNGYLIISL